MKKEKKDPRAFKRKTSLNIQPGACLRETLADWACTSSGVAWIAGTLGQGNVLCPLSARFNSVLEQ